jgi:hypothetical protein
VGYVWHVGTLRDGKLTTEIPVSSSSWSLVMDDAGTMQVTMPLADADVAALNPYLIAEPCRCFLAVAYNDPDGGETFLEAGPIWLHKYDGASKQLTIGASGVWSYYDHRKVLPVLAAGVNPATVTTEIVASLGTTAKRLVELAHTHANGALPIVLPADIAGSVTSTLPGAEMHDVGQSLRDLSQLESGPEIQFRPRRREDDGRFLEWDMRIGTDVQPLLFQQGADWTWDTSAATSSASSINVSRDAAKVGTRVWMQGAGTDTTTLFGRADSTLLTNAGFPLLEVQGSGQEQNTSTASLNSAARGLLRKSNRPTETWTVTVRRDETPRVGQYAIGDWASLTIAGDPYLPDGTYRTRITSIGDQGDDIALGLAPTIGGL